MIHGLLTWLGAIGSGESSPLSVESTYAEIMRLAQVGIFGGVLYLIQRVKTTHSSSDETHSTIIAELKEVQASVTELRTEVNSIRKRSEEP